MYFKYGIKNSTLETGKEHEGEVVTEPSGGMIELKVTDMNRPQASSPYATSDRSIYESDQLDAFGQPVFGSTSFGGTAAAAHTSSTAQASSSSALFIAPDSFPTWDD